MLQDESFKLHYRFGSLNSGQISVNFRNILSIKGPESETKPYCLFLGLIGLIVSVKIRFICSSNSIVIVSLQITIINFFEVFMMPHIEFALLTSNNRFVLTMLPQIFELNLVSVIYHMEITA